MTARELIQAEIDNLDDAALNELYVLVQDFVRSRQKGKPQSLMAKLKTIKIEAPEDFAANLDLYLNGEKCVESDLR
ncbi:hypothetical protein C7B61_15580 [filamentous cyanobacterium CCP1]|nr:hypothetical protein C7B76_23575 [filamentous cyanobacterium CCP2]PSB61695.1 hypothetical protein C7B61_15580 [filamentous cyanobacterium CCP1]